MFGRCAASSSFTGAIPTYADATTEVFCSLLFTFDKPSPVYIWQIIPCLYLTNHSLFIFDKPSLLYIWQTIPCLYLTNHPLFIFDKPSLVYIWQTIPAPYLKGMQALMIPSDLKCHCNVSVLPESSSVGITDPTSSVIATSASYLKVLL